MILLNSCSVREKAEHKAYSRLGEYRLLKRSRPDLILGFCGCVAQQEGERALKRLPELDFVLGTGCIGELGTMVDHARRGSRRVLTGFPAHPQYDFDEISRAGDYKGMVTVVEGCNKRCTFCIVPTTRGAERCRSLEQIVSEVRHLVDYGFVEIELLGQTVNHWRGTGSDGEELDFADLLDAVAEVGVQRLRFITSYARDFTPRMVERIGRHPNICPYLHLPVQSGSNRILQRMGRGYSVDEYRQLVAALREVRRGLALATDIIVGFPGETKADFQATLDLVAELRFSGIYAFKYSPRPGTAALRLGERVSQADADRRLQALFSLQNEIQRELNQQLVGHTMEVLVTGVSKDARFLTARTTCHRVVIFESSFDVTPFGQVTEVVIEKALAHSLVAHSLVAHSLMAHSQVAHSQVALPKRSAAMREGA